MDNHNLNQYIHTHTCEHYVIYTIEIAYMKYVYSIY